MAQKQNPLRYGKGRKIILKASIFLSERRNMQVRLDRLQRGLIICGS